MKSLMRLGGATMLLLVATLELSAHTATADASSGRIYDDGNGNITVKSNSGALTYVGRVGGDSVAVFCFQMPNYPAGEVIDSAEFSAYVNTVADTNQTLGNAVVYAVRTDTSPGIQASDMTGGTVVVSTLTTSGDGVGYKAANSSSNPDLVNWLAANAAPNEYVILRIEADSNDNYHRYNFSDESITNQEPTLTFTSSAPPSNDHEAIAHSSSGRIKKTTSGSTYTIYENSAQLTYIGNVGSEDSVAVYCFQMPNYPAGEAIDSVELSIFINAISNGNQSLGNASLYGVRAGASPGMINSDFDNGAALVSNFIVSSGGTGYYTIMDEVVDGVGTPFTDWLNANAAPNEYIFLKLQTPAGQDSYHRYNASDESVSGEEPAMFFTTTAAVPVTENFDATVDAQTGRIYEHTSTGDHIIKDNTGAYGYVGNVGVNNSVATLVFQMPDYPASGTFDAAELSVFVNGVGNTPEPASIYAIRSSSSPTIDESDYDASATEIADDVITAAGGAGRYTIDDSTALVSWLQANASPNEYVIFRVEIDTTQGSYDYYKISDESISGEEPTLSFDITSSGGGGGGGGGGGNPGSWGTFAWDPAPWQAAQGANNNWEDISVLDALIQAAPSGGTVDITGRYFRSTPSSSYIGISQPVDIVGGYISGATSLSWTHVGNGVYKASLDLSAMGTDGLTTLEDPDADHTPLMAVYPPPPSGTLLAGNRTAVNDNWWEIKTQPSDGGINKGVIHTTTGDDDTGKITGFTITDATLRNAVDAAIDGDVSSILVLYHASPNLVDTRKVASWNGATGALTFADQGQLSYSNYFRFVITGRPEFIDGEANAYVCDFATNEIYYKPVDNDPTGTGASVIPELFRVYSDDVTFTDCYFASTNFNSSAPAMVKGSGTPSVEFDGCVFSNGMVGIRDMVVDADLCQFSYMLNRGMAVLEGTRVTRSRFEHIEESSSILVQRSSTIDSADDPIPESYFEGNLFYLPASTHGQGISLYTCTWQNATIINNIFLSCDRAISFQPKSGSNVSLRNTVPGTFRFENNMVWTEELAVPDAGGQKTIEFNGADDTHLAFGEQAVYFRYNVIGAKDNNFGIKTYYVSLGKLEHSDVWIDGNIAGTISANDGDPGMNKHQHSRNLLDGVFLSAYGNSLGATDLPFMASATAYDRDNLSAIGAAATAAPDNGRIGVRWMSMPTPDEMKSLPLDWVDVALPESLPTTTDWSDAVFNTDLR